MGVERSKRWEQEEDEGKKNEEEEGKMKEKEGKKE